MKIIHKIFDKLGANFQKGAKFEKFYPLFDATETFFFTPGIASKNVPHVRDSLDLKRFMSIVILALLPCLIFGIYNTGYHSNLACGIENNVKIDFLTGLWIVIPLIIVSYTVGIFWEFIFASIRGHKISEGFFVTGMLYPLILPPSIPLWQAAIGISFGVIIGKEVFGGTGRNFLNPALTARAFLFFAYPIQMSGDNVWTASFNPAAIVDSYSGATPLSVAGFSDISNTIESVLIQNGYTFSNLFMGYHPGSIGETSVLLCFIGALILIFTGIASYKIIIGGILGVLCTGGLLNIIAYKSASQWLLLNPFYHLVMGGFAFGITYMATDPVTAPGTEISKWIYGFAIGFLTVIIRVFNPAYPEGVMLSILFMNIFAPLLEHIEIKLCLARRIPNV